MKNHLITDPCQLLSWSPWMSKAMSAWPHCWGLRTVDRNFIHFQKLWSVLKMSFPVTSKLGSTHELFQTGDPTKLIDMPGLRPADHMCPGTAMNMAQHMCGSQCHTPESQGWTPLLDPHRQMSFCSKAVCSKPSDILGRISYLSNGKYQNKSSRWQREQTLPFAPNTKNVLLPEANYF